MKQIKCNFQLDILSFYHSKAPDSFSFLEEIGWSRELLQNQVAFIVHLLAHLKHNYFLSLKIQHLQETYFCFNWVFWRRYLIQLKKNLVKPVLYILFIFFPKSQDIGYSSLCCIQQDLVVYPLFIQQFASPNPRLPIHPSQTSVF